MFVKKVVADVIQNSLYDALNASPITGVVRTFTGEEYSGEITVDYKVKRKPRFTPDNKQVGTQGIFRIDVIVRNDSNIHKIPITEVLYIKTNHSLSMIEGIYSKPYNPKLNWEFKKHPIYKKILRWIDNKVPVGFVLYNGVMFKGTIYSVYPFTYIISLSTEKADVIIPKHSITVITNCPDEFYPIYLASYVKNRKNMPDLQHAVPKNVWWKKGWAKKLYSTIKHRKFVSVLLRDHSVSFLGRAAMLSPTIYGLKIYVKRVPDDYAQWRARVTGKPIEEHVGCVALIYRHAIKGFRWIRKRDLLKTPTSKKVKRS